MLGKSKHLVGRDAVIAVHSPDHRIGTDSLRDAGRRHAQPQIPLHGAVGKLLFIVDDQSAFLDGELLKLRQGGVDIRGRASDIYQDQRAGALLLIGALGQQLAGQKHRTGRRHHSLIGQAGAKFHQAPGPGDLPDKLFVDGLAGRLDIQLVNRRHDIRHAYIGDTRFVKKLCHSTLCILVARHDHGRLAVQLADHLRVFQGASLVPAVCPTGKQDDVGINLHQHFPAEGQRLLGGNHLHHPRAGCHSHLLGGLGGDARHISESDHTQPPGGGTGAVPFHLRSKLHTLGLDSRLGSARAFHNVVQRGGRLAAPQESKAPVLQREGRRLGIGASHIINKDIGLHFNHFHQGCFP